MDLQSLVCCKQLPTAAGDNGDEGGASKAAWKSQRHAEIH